MASRPSNRPASSSPSSIPPSPERPYSEAQPAPRAKSTTFKKLLPFAASLAVIVVVGALFFPRFGTQYSQEYEASSPNPGSTENSLPRPDNEEKMLIALSLESTDKSGEAIHEVLLFMVGSQKLDSLDLLDPGNFSMVVFPASDTVNLSLGIIPELSVREIQDSVHNTSAKPVVVGNLRIDRSELKVNPKTQIINSQPQRLDTISFKKLQMKARIPREN